MRIQYLILIILFSCCQTENNKVLKLKNKFKFSFSIEEAEPVFRDDIIYFAADGNNIVGINSVKGTLEFDYWDNEGVYEFSMDNSIIVYVSKDWSLKIIDVSLSDSSWTFNDLPRISTNVIIQGHKVYFGTTDCHVYCVDIEKKIIDWKYDVKERIGSTILVSKDNVYLKYENSWMMALLKSSGKEKWSVKNSQDYFSISLVNDDLILNERCKVIGIESESLEEEWQISANIYPSSFAIDKGIIYARVDSDKMSAIEIKSGKELWSSQIDCAMFNPIIGFNSNLYVIEKQAITQLNINNGEIVNRYRTTKEIRAQPIMYENVIYCGGYRNYEAVEIYEVE